jgi:very-short-patch-repair endonuclease
MLKRVRHRELTNSSIVTYAKALRKNSTKEEKKLWTILKNKNLADCKFRRQEPIGKYIVDFICYSKKLIVELDGGQHNIEKNIVLDINRTKHLEQEGYRILRFWNNEVFENIEGVKEEIFKALTLNPLPRGEGKEEGKFKKENEKK